MFRSKAILFFLLLIPQGLWASAQITQALMTTSMPAQDCSTPSTGTSTLSPTVSVGYLWFLGLGLNTGDIVSTAFFTPSGQWYSAAGVQFQAVPSAGMYCFTDGSFLIAGHTPASTPGVWTAYIYDNGVSVGSLTFTISASTCTYTLVTSSASIPASAGTGSFGITAGNSCPWTATSNSTWLTTSSSGSGSGTVNYSVTANTATTARSGTITVGSQTFTVTQAASSGGSTSSGNLVVNGDAETGTANGFAGQPSIAGWTTDGNVAIVAYTDGGGDLTPTSPGPSNRGNNYFSGGGAGVSKMSQTIDVSSYATAIDGGSQPYTLEGWLGGYDGQDDNATVQATFLSVLGVTLGTATIGPVLSADRGGVSELMDVSTTGKIPANTRKVLIAVTFTRTSGSDNDGLMDNLYFGLSSGGATSGASTVYLRFENGTANATATGSGSILDSSGSGQNGTPSGAVTYSSDVPLSTVGGAANTLSLNLTTSGSVQFPEPSRSIASPTRPWNSTLSRRVRGARWISFGPARTPPMPTASTWECWQAAHPASFWTTASLTERGMPWPRSLSPVPGGRMSRW